MGFSVCDQIQNGSHYSDSSWAGGLSMGFSVCDQIQNGSHYSDSPRAGGLRAWIFQFVTKFKMVATLHPFFNQGENSSNMKLITLFHLVGRSRNPHISKLLGPLYA
jgi:hypothetical protein